MGRMYLILSLLGWAWLAVVIVAWLWMCRRGTADRFEANERKNDQQS